MQFCKEHWEQLKQAIKDKGMWHLVSKSGEDAINIVKSELLGEERNFDPLLAAHSMMCSRAIELGGLYFLQPDKDGNPLCPLCEGNKEFDDLAKNWIDGSTDECLDYCKKHKLLDVN